MRVLAMTTAILLSCTWVPCLADESGSLTNRQAQTAPVQPDRTPQQADQAREQERKDAEDVQIGRDWKAQGGEADRVGRSDQSDQDHQTVGRDWRAHPENQERR